MVRQSVNCFRLIITVMILLGLICGCSKRSPEEPNGTTASAEGQPSAPPNGDVDVDNPTPQDRTLGFTYEDLTLPERIISAEHIYVCYQDSTRIVFSLGIRNGKEIGPLIKAETLALTMINGETVYYPVDTEADIISAVPYRDGLLYMVYLETQSAFQWSTVLTDGIAETVVDTGTVADFRDIPYLFMLDEYPYYMVKEENGYCVRRIAEGVPETVYAESECELLEVMAGSNGKEFCYMVDYSDKSFARFVVSNEQGVLHSSQLTGKITSFGITAQYAICVTGNEETQICNVEMLDINTGDTIVLPQPVAPLWQLRGAEDVVIGVDDYWKPYAIDVENRETVEIEAPAYSVPLRYYPLDDMRYLVFVDGGERSFYILTISPK